MGSEIFRLLCFGLYWLNFKQHQLYKEKNIRMTLNFRKGSRNYRVAACMAVRTKCRLEVSGSHVLSMIPNWEKHEKLDFSLAIFAVFIISGYEFQVILSNLRIKSTLPNMTIGLLWRLHIWGSWVRVAEWQLATAMFLHSWHSKIGQTGFTETSVRNYHSIPFPCMALQPLPGLGLPQKLPPFVPVFSSSSPSSYSSYS